MAPVAIDPPQRPSSCPHRVDLRLTWAEVKRLDQRVTDQGNTLTFLWQRGWDICHFQHVYTHGVDGEVVGIF